MKDFKRFGYLLYSLFAFVIYIYCCHQNDKLETMKKTRDLSYSHLSSMESSQIPLDLLDSLGTLFVSLYCEGLKCEETLLILYYLPYQHSTPVSL